MSFLEWYDTALSNPHLQSQLLVGMDVGFGGLGFRVWGFRVKGLGFWVWGLGFRVWGFRVLGLGFGGLGFSIASPSILLLSSVIQ